MRNGDYSPSRYQAQIGAMHTIFSTKTQANPESTVGIMTMAGGSPEVLVTLTADMGKILSGVHNTKIGGIARLATGIEVAALALKHRQNKIQRQRIVVFVGSPIQEDSRELVRLAKKMKKNNVAVDFVNFGEEAENTERLESFMSNVNSHENSHLITVPPGPHLLMDVVASSPICIPEGSDHRNTSTGTPGGEPAGARSFEFGVDPSVDPELALALRMSLEDERARQERARQAHEQQPPTDQSDKPAGSS